MNWRAISSAEASLVAFLCGIAESVNCPADWAQLEVRSLDDGGMGSFQIAASPTLQGQGSKLVASTGQALDLDGVLLIATLFIDEDRRPCEVDIWKVNFEPLQQMPMTWEAALAPRLPGSGLGQ